jgi:hypothetical protein
MSLDRPLPLADTAVIAPRVQDHLSIAVGGEIFLVFPRGVAYIKVKRIADKWPGSEIRLIKVRTTYEILEENHYYDTSASI